ncbi:MAG: TorF family putative porin [Burkholderiales bacterium]
MFKKSLKAGAIAAALALPGFAFGQAAPAPAADAKPAEPKPSYTLTGNVGLFSQYIFRGLKQTGTKPAIQGGFDYAHESGFYAGTWASNISWLKENATTAAGAVGGTYGEGGSLEWDFYGGYKWNLPNDFVIDVGALYYWYPGSINPAASAAAAPNSVPKGDTLEFYVAPSWKWVTLKYSYSALDHTFGVTNSRGTGYLELNANPPIGDTGFTVNLHVGYQKYKGTDPRNAAVGGVVRSNDSVDSYKDYKIGVSYALPKDFTIGAFYSKATSSDVCGYGAFTQVGAGCTGPYPSNIAKSTGTVFVQKTF